MLDMRGMPPAVAEVYTLAVLQHLQRHRNPRCGLPDMNWKFCVHISSQHVPAF